MPCSRGSDRGTVDARPAVPPQPAAPVRPAPALPVGRRTDLVCLASQTERAPGKTGNECTPIA